MNLSPNTCYDEYPTKISELTWVWENKLVTLKIFCLDGNFMIWHKLYLSFNIELHLFL